MSILKRTKDTPKSEGGNLERFRHKKRKWWLWGPLLLIAAILTWYVATIFIAFNRATTDNISGGSKALQDVKNKDYEPINVLLIGSDSAASLADTIMVASIDFKANTVSLISLPRDLYVTIPGYGKDKINAAHSLGERTKKGNGPILLKETVSTTLGVPLHYFVRIDFEGFEKVIDTIGGVTVNVSESIYDPEYPDKNHGYDPFNISKGTHHLNGATALKYARSRKTTSDFDRARRQQEIIVAAKDKMLSAQTLANPKKVTDIISVLGQHILTDFSSTEIDTLLRIAKDFTNPTIQSKVVDNGETGLLASGRSAVGASILVPKAGANDFSEIQRFTQAYFAAPRIKAEKSTIRLERGTATKSAFATVQSELETAGFTVIASEEQNTAESATVLYSYSSGKKADAEKFFKDVYNLTPKKGTAAATDGDLVDYSLVVGSDLLKTSKSSPKPSPKTQTAGHELLKQATSDTRASEGTRVYNASN